MVKTKLLIWDWNGTLLDDTACCFEITNAMRRERGMAPLPDLDTYRGLFRFPVIDYYRDMGYTFETESYEAISVDYIARYAAAVGGCTLQQGALETLETVKRMGIPQRILSATGQERLDIETELFGIRSYFIEILGQKDNLAHSKVERGRAYLAKSGIAPQSVLFVGDTDHDYEVASAMGCRVALLSCGHQTRDKLERCGAPILDALSELPSLL